MKPADEEAGFIVVVARDWAPWSDLEALERELNAALGALALVTLRVLQVEEVTLEVEDEDTEKL